MLMHTLHIEMEIPSVTFTNVLGPQTMAGAPNDSSHSIHCRAFSRFEASDLFGEACVMI